MDLRRSRPIRPAPFRVDPTRRNDAGCHRAAPDSRHLNPPPIPVARVRRAKPEGSWLKDSLTVFMAIFFRKALCPLPRQRRPINRCASVVAPSPRITGGIVAKGSLRCVSPSVQRGSAPTSRSRTMHHLMRVSLDTQPSRRQPSHGRAPRHLRRGATWRARRESVKKTRSGVRLHGSARHGGGDGIPQKKLPRTAPRCQGGSIPICRGAQRQMRSRDSGRWAMREIYLSTCRRRIRR